MLYDLIIIGAGAAGLFAGASLPFPIKGLILEKKAAPGRKLLMSGSGQCNLTHGGSIKDFIPHYGKNGPQVRSVLYRFNNESVINFFEERGVSLFEREDGKVFPKSLKAQDILGSLTDSCKKNGLQFVYSSPVDCITLHENVYTVRCGNRSYDAGKLIIATGGCSYPTTGSDGSFFNVLREMGIDIISPTPALVPINVKQYPYGSLSGISFQNAEAALGSRKNRDALLFTHSCFSGPVVLNLSRYASQGDTITFNYCPNKPEDIIYKELLQSAKASMKQLLTVLYEYFKEQEQVNGELPKRFLEVICKRAGAEPTEKVSRLSPVQLKSIVRLIVRDSYIVQKLGGFDSAMVTSGGISLSEINLKTMESNKYKNLYFAGEVTDVDGDTGGYNLQYAFSSGCLAGRSASGVIG